MIFSIVIPAKNEEAGLAIVLPKLKSLAPLEIIVVNDGSTDNTSKICKENGVIELKHPYSKGNGAAIKSGLRAASADYVLFMDADAQHDVSNVTRVLDAYRSGDDMVVGARSFKHQASVGRGVANGFYNWFASTIVGHKVQDLTSGLRLVDRKKMLEFIHLLPNGFSYPTTITMAFFRAGYSVKYVPVEVFERKGKSHLRPFSDGVRFLLIIFKVASLYSPLKIYFPASLLMFLMGAGYYLYTYLLEQRFTNMGMLLFSTSIIVFFIGLVSEQITALNYQRRG
ncbi:glycosyltransferase family 2 protein [Simiduia aestuariiviva]|uniref:Glycosyltransferase involved in cell wall biosynthesis n=1 Tax=Simiduia aestuariiviva TaxID=1510459 RepID=A0A839UUP5_9GAMM|nr:glycosyltransferase family 2 protein [Simiduia aestuariiviva]MBB3169085.1 glycosyltransferase involved in cell wall biosynthesis [Simiduia aestuariiviva]